MKKLIFVLAAVVLCAVSIRAEIVSWTYRQNLGEAPDSVRYLVFHGFDSVGSFAGLGVDSLYFTLSIQDTTINWVIPKIYWNGFDSAQGGPVWFGNWWTANGSSYYYPIRYYWCDPPDSVLRRIWIDNVLTYTDTLPGPVYRDVDSILITDTTGVRFSYTEYFGDITTGFTDVVPTMSPYTTSEIIVDTLSDTVWWPDEVGPSDSDLCAVFCVYYKNHSPVRGAWLIVMNPNTGYDSTNGVILGPSLERDESSVLGIASVSVLRSTIYADSLTSLYDIKLMYGGRIVRSWSRMFIPDQDTLRLEVRQ